MAIYHLTTKPISRSTGRSAVHCAAYRSAEKLNDQRLQQTFDYTRKGGVVHKEILTPDNAPAWAKVRERLWNEAEAAEKRKDARVAREIEIALPQELSLDQQKELVRGFVRDVFVSQGMIADAAIHEPHTKQADKRNPHAHIMLTTRSVGPEGFGLKVTAWDRKDVLLDWRKQWAEHANRALELAGHDVRIDHRSFKDQGIELEPGVKIGTAARDGVQVVAQRRAEQAEIQRRNGEAIIAFPDIALVPISKERAAFTRGNVRAFLKTHTVDAAQLEAALHAVMHSPDLVQVGKDSRGYVHYTTRDMLATEQRMLNAADLMAARLGHWVNPKYCGQALTGLSQGPLSADQRKAFDHVMSDNNLAVVQGYAGTGKSYMLAAAREAWEAQGYRVIGGALAGKAAEGLQISSGIPSRTLASWELMWQHGHGALTSRNVLVIDEAGMVGTRQLARVLERADEAGAKVVLVGDTRQLAAIEAGAPMRAIAERIGMVELTDIRRQKGWQAQATKDFGAGLTDKALDAYKQHGCILEHATQDEALCAMVEAWDERRKVAPKETLVMLAHRNVDVDELNALARAKRRQAGELGGDHHIASERGPLDLATGDRAMFLKNDRQLGVLNGTLGTVEEISGRELLVRLDDGREVAFDTKDYGDLRHGYAATVHKEQGVTVDRAYVLAGRTFDKQLVYVGMSRHRGSVELHWSREAFATEQELREALGREGGKVNVTDLAPKTVNQLSQLAELEDRETWLSARFHPSMAAAFGRNLTAEEFALRDTRDAREHKEHELYAAQQVGSPAIAKAPTSTALSPEQRLADSLAIHAGTAETWQNWRDAVPADQQLDARLGRGEGSKPCLTFRETRAWAQEAGRDVQQKPEVVRVEEWGIQTRGPHHENVSTGHAVPTIPPPTPPEPVKRPPAQIGKHEARPPIQPQLDAAVVHRRTDIDRVVIDIRLQRLQLAQERAQEQQREQAEAVKLERQRQPRAEQIGTEEAVERGKRLWGHKTFAELERLYNLAQQIQNRSILDRLGPYYEHVKQEHDAQLAKQAQQKQHKPEPDRPAPKPPAPDLYAQLPGAEIIRRYEQAAKLGAQEHKTPAQMFEQLVEVQSARYAVKEAEKLAASWQSVAEEHRARQGSFLAKLSWFDPKVEVGALTMKLSEAVARFDEDLEKARLSMDKLERDPKMWKQAERAATEHNRAVDEANVELGRLRPYKAQAEQEIRKDVERWENRLAEERAKEALLEKGRGISH